MSIETIIGQYGYLALIIGTFFEGETVLILGGFLAHRGYFSLPLVIIFALAGTLAGDQLYFFIGKKKGNAFLNTHPYLKGKIARFSRLLNKYHLPVILGFRFLYGLRTVAPFAIGLTRISFLTFFILNLVSATVWAIIIGSLGYYFGRGIEIILEDLKKYEIWILVSGCIFIILKFAISYLKRTRLKKISRQNANK